jgi:glycosyltransferase involved in cell wall biosynthesis
LVPRADSKSLAEALERLIVDSELRKKFGRNGRLRIEQKFKQEIVWQGTLNLFKEMLGN